MAGMFFRLPITKSLSSQPKTVAQFLIAANTRVQLHGIDVFPLGATGASVPLTWHLKTQTSAGTGADATGDIIKQSPSYPGTQQTTARKDITVEPTGPVLKYKLQAHQQAALYWRPPDGPITMEAAERWALIFVSAVDGINCEYMFYLEE